MEWINVKDQWMPLSEKPEIKEKSQWVEWGGTEIRVNTYNGRQVGVVEELNRLEKEKKNEMDRNGN